MKKSLIFTIMLVSVLALGYSQSALSGTYRYSTNAYITFAGNDFVGSWNATSPISGTYSVSGSRLTLSITGGPKSPDTWGWSIVDTNTLRDQDGDQWSKEGTIGNNSIQAPAQPPISWSVNNITSYVEAVNGIRSSGNNRVHIITIIGNITVPIGGEGMFGSVTGVTLTVQGNGNVLSLSGNGCMFHIGNRQTVVLKDISLQGRDSNNSSMVVIMNGGTFRMEGSASITGNKVTDSHGGGVLVNGGNFIMQNNASLSGNTSTNGNGGGVYVSNNGTITMQSGNISNNSSQRGGGVYINNNGTFTMQNGTISSNTSESNGGGVYINDNGTFTMQNGTISGNTTSTKMDNAGGGVYIGKNGTFTMLNGTISDNTAIGSSNSWAPIGVAVYGGGVYISGGTFTMQGGKILNNIVKAIRGGGYSSNSAKGGGIYLDGGTFTMQGNATVSGNTATSEGDYSKCGGGVYINNGTFTMRDNTSVSGNNATAGSGGGVYINDNGAFAIQSNAIVSGNTASWGGGVYYDGKSFNMHGGTVSGNTASWGGGVYVRPNRSFVMQNGTILNNTANLGGGGVFIDDNGTFTMQGGILSGNTAKSNEGGGIYVRGESDGGNFIKTGGTLYGNDAANELKNKSYVIGHAVFNEKTTNWRNTTAGVSMNTTSFGFWLNEGAEAKIQHDQGVEYCKKGDYDRAITAFTEAIRLNPNNISSYDWRGYAYRNKGDYDRAITDYNQVIQLEPNEADLYRAHK